ncbi:hypothetical protein FNH22_02725 [Fulvivirga sp. M361]|uniref:hypothetical protein n=1 Tax=Fulvivirga sp. M361 TaxID=2594266 RepID=UPI00117B3E72|nr:hypothetical protein [Fulvivirga sp. M361]TRX61711.1 hypothetical protein FNH22_02725 [Fulvivirga sp. M361]
MSLKFSAFLSLCVLIVALSCEDTEPEIDNIDPFLNIVFINGDSLDQLNALIEEIDLTVKDIDDTIAILALDSVIDRTETIDSLNEEKAALNTTKSAFNLTVTDIESGSVRVFGISSPAGINPIIPSPDSAEIFRIPLNPAEDISEFEISLEGQQYDLKATYERNTVVEQRTVIVEAFLTDVISESLEITYICQDSSTTCTSNETTVTARF